MKNEMSTESKPSAMIATKNQIPVFKSNRKISVNELPGINSLEVSQVLAIARATTKRKK
jgi:hypothetical protein